MTTASEGAELTQVGPGTPMGRLMRHYWLPALLSSELERDGPPTRFMLLGEKLLAFRDSAGRVGVMDHRCPHRCASLFLGRNEQGGLRCIYHGWKFDVFGNCLDMPNVPEDQDFKHKVKAKAYRTVERAGLVWVYMGEGEPQSTAGLRGARFAARRDQRPHDAAQLQLAAGARGRDRHRPFRLPAWRPRRSEGRARDRSVLLHHHQPRAAVPRRRRAVGHAVCRLPRRRTGPDLLALRQLPVPLLVAGAQRRIHEPHARPRLGAARRRPHHVRLHLLEEGQVGAGPAAAQVQGRHADRRHRPRRHQNAAQHHAIGWAAGAWPWTRATTGAWTATPSAATGSTAASTASTCRTRRSPRAWGRSPTSATSTWRRRTR